MINKLSVKDDVVVMDDDDTDKAFKVVRPNTNLNIDDYLHTN